MFSKTIRYTAFILALIVIIVWTFSFFFRKNDSKETIKLLKSAADSIEYAKINITKAQNRIDSLLWRIDSINNVISGITKKVTTGNTNFQSTLQKNRQELDGMKKSVIIEQSEMDKLKEQLKQLK